VALVSCAQGSAGGKRSNVELTGASGHASEDQSRMFERPG